jgi:hypothetical protein
VIGRPESLAAIIDCYPTGLIVSDDVRWRNPATVDAAVASLIKTRAEEVELSATSMHAFVWRRPDEARRAEACADLPAGLVDGVTPGLGQGHAQ